MSKSIGDELEVAHVRGKISLTFPEDVDEIALNTRECEELVSFILEAKDLARIFRLDSFLDLSRNLVGRETQLEDHGNHYGMVHVDSLEASIAKQVDSDSELRVVLDSNSYTYYMKENDGLNLARLLVTAFKIHPTSLYENSVESDGEDHVQVIDSRASSKVFEVERIFNG